jgi:ribonuclease HI
MFTIYTDGAYSQLHNIGACAFVILDEESEKSSLVKEGSKAFRNSTSQRMELYAILYALKQFKSSEQLLIITDSQYAVGELTLNWKRTSNIKLLEAIEDELTKHQYKFQHVKGHNGDRWNEYVDKKCAYLINKVLKTGN